jgi:2-C-methyl-D-erythritol 4-phosphate cytidylyltransferase
MTSVIAIVPAAGDSTRMASAGSKALLRLGDLTVIERTIQTLRASPRIKQIIVAAPINELGHFQEVLGRFDVAVIQGGITRQESVWKALQRAETFKPTSESLVLVHDAARCFVSQALIESCIDAALSYEAVTAAVKVSDTLKCTDRFGQISSGVDRSSTWAIQTPQVFRYSLILAGHQAAVARGDKSATDDTSLVEGLCPAHIVEGSRWNFKLTYPEDFEVARRLL